MTHNAMHLGRVATIVVPVTDQEAALAFYTQVLGMSAVNDFDYPTGERWLEVSPAAGSANLCLVLARPSRPTGVETGIVLFSSDLRADLATCRAHGASADEEPLPKGEVIWWSGAPLGGVPTQFRLRDPDGNAFLVVQAP